MFVVSLRLSKQQSDVSSHDNGFAFCASGLNTPVVYACNPTVCISDNQAPVCQHVHPAHPRGAVRSSLMRQPRAEPCFTFTALPAVNEGLLSFVKYTCVIGLSDCRLNHAALPCLQSMRGWPPLLSTSALLLPSQRCQGKPSSRGPPHLMVCNETALQVDPPHSCITPFEDCGVLLCSDTV